MEIKDKYAEQGWPQDRIYTQRSGNIRHATGKSETNWRKERERDREREKER